MQDEDGPPRYAVDQLTEAQVAMLALLGGVEARPRRSIALLHDTPAVLAKVAPGLSPNIVKDHACPVVEWHGALRMIMPSGDVWSVADEPPSGSR